MTCLPIRFFRCALFLGVLAHLSGLWNVQADTRTWGTTGSSTWTNPAAWINGVPTSSDNVVIGMGEALLPSGVNGSYLVLTLGSASRGSINVSGGLLTGLDAVIGPSVGTSGTARVSGGYWQNQRDLSIGTSGTGTLLVTGGIMQTQNGYVGGNGIVTVAGGTFASSLLQLQDSGTLSLNSGSILTSIARLGVSGGVSNVTITSGTWNSSSFMLGWSGTGNLTMSGGLVTASGLYVGYTSVGMATVSSGSWTGDSLDIGYQGKGTLAISGGGDVSVQGATTVGNLLFSTGTLTLSGSGASRGRLTTASLAEQTGTGVVIIDGGILRAASDQADFITGFETGDITLSTGGAFIDTNGFAIGISAALGGTGSLVKIGNGTLTLSGANTFGGTIVKTGTLALSGGTINHASGTMVVGDASGDAGSLVVGSGGGIASASGIIGNAAGSTGRVTVANGGVWTNSGTLTMGSSGTGFLTLSGSSGSQGVVSTRRIVEGAGAGSITFDGGVLQARASESDFLSGFEAGDLTIATGGLVFDTNSFNVGISYSFNGGGGLVKQGGGSLVLTGTNSFAGNALVRSGTLVISGGLTSVGSGTVTLSGASEDGRMVVNGGTLSSSASVVSQGSTSLAYATVSSGKWITTGTLTVGNWNGTIFLNGAAGNRGTVAAGRVVEGTGVGRLTFDGGILQALASQSDFLSGFEAGDVQVLAGGAFVDSNGFSIGISSAFTGAGRLTKIGEGLLTLGGSNTYTGGTIVKSGTLAVGAGGSINDSAATVTVGETSGDNGALLVNGGKLLSTTGVIGSGAGSIGSATVASGTWVNSGTVTVGGSGTGTLTLSAGGGNRGLLSTLQVAEAGSGTVIFDGGVLQARAAQGDLLAGFEAGDVRLAAGGAFIDTNGFAIGITASLSGTGSLTKQGEGTLTLSGSNTYSGGTVINSGTLRLGGANALGAAGPLAIQNGTVELNDNTLAGALSGSSGAVITVGSAGDYAFTARQTADSAYAGILQDGSGKLSLIKEGTGTLTLTGSHSYTGDTVVRNGTVILSGGGSINHAGATVIVGDEYGGSGALLVNGGQLASTSGVLGNAAGSNGSVTVSSGTWINSGTITLGKAGTGSLTLNSGALLSTSQIAQGAGAGLLYLNGGILQARGGQSDFLSGFALGYLTISPGGALIDTNGFDVGISSPMSGAGGLIKMGAGNLTLSSFTAMGGDMTVKSGTLTLTGTLSSNGTAFIAGEPGDNGAFVINGGSVNNASAFVGRQGGAAGSVAVNGGGWYSYGELLVGGTNASGSVHLNGGEVWVRNNSTIGTGSGTGSVTITSGTWTQLGEFVIGINQGKGSLQIDGGLVSSGLTTLGAYSALGTATITSGTWSTGSTFLIGAFSGTGQLTIDGGYVSSVNTDLGSFGNGIATVNGGTWAHSGDLVLGHIGSGTLNVNSGLVTVSGTTSFTRPVMPYGGGQITLSGSHGNRGTLSTSRVVAAPGMGKVAFDGGILQARANESDFLSGFNAGDVTISSGGAFIDTAAFTVGIAAQLSGTGGLTKRGEGTLALSGINTYAGATEVEDGVLLITGDSSGTGGFEIRDGGTLGGNGRTSGVTVRDGGTLAPGTSPGLLTIDGDLTLEAGSAIVMEFTGTAAGAFDQIAITDIFTAAGTLYLDVNYAVAEGDTFVLFTDGTSARGWDAGNLSVATNLGNGLYWDTSDLGATGIVTVVPEPSAGLLLMLGFAAVLWARRRNPTARREA